MYLFFFISTSGRCYVEVYLPVHTLSLSLSTRCYFHFPLSLDLRRDPTLSVLSIGDLVTFQHLHKGRFHVLFAYLRRHSKKKKIQYPSIICKHSKVITSQLRYFGNKFIFGLVFSYNKHILVLLRRKRDHP